MSETSNLTDAELAARWGAQALTEGRYELGAALARIAQQAARAQHGVAAVPMLGATRDEEPARPADLDTYRAAQEAQTELFGTSANTTTGIAPTSRCAFTQGVQMCDKVIWWQEGNIGDAEHPAMVAGWRHMDPELDQYHAPIPRS